MFHENRRSTVGGEVSGYYSRSTVLRQTSLGFLKDYFSRYPSFEDVDWSTPFRDKIKRLDALIDALDSRAVAAVESDLRMVHELADQHGAVVVGDCLWQYELDEAAVGGPFDNHHDRAMGLLLHRGLSPKVDLFDWCLGASRIERLRSARSRRRRGFSGCVPATDDGVRLKLANAVIEAFKKERRGRPCVVDCYRRRGPDRYCFFAHPADFAVSDLSYNDEEQLERRTRKPTFELGWIFRPDEGYIEVRGQMDRRRADALAEAFRLDALGGVEASELRPDRDFDLAVLLSPTAEFATDRVPEPDEEPIEGLTEGIKEAKTLALRLCVKGDAARTVTYKVPSGDERGIHDWMNSMHNFAAVPRRQLVVLGATIRVEFHPPPGSDKERGRIVTFDISTPNVLGLDDGPHELLIQRYLKTWNLLRA